MNGGAPISKSSQCQCLLSKLGPNQMLTRFLNMKKDCAGKLQGFISSKDTCFLIANVSSEVHGFLLGELIILIFVSKEKNLESHSSDPLNLVVTINEDVLLFGCLNNLP